MAAVKRVTAAAVVAAYALAVGMALSHFPGVTAGWKFGRSRTNGKADKNRRHLEKLGPLEGWCETDNRQ